MCLPSKSNCPQQGFNNINTNNHINKKTISQDEQQAADNVPVGGGSVGSVAGLFVAPTEPHEQQQQQQQRGGRDGQPSASYVGE